MLIAKKNKKSDCKKSESNISPLSWMLCKKDKNEKLNYVCFNDYEY